MSEKSILGVHPDWLEGKPWEKFGMEQEEYEFQCLQGYPPMTIRGHFVCAVGGGILAIAVAGGMMGLSRIILWMAS